MAKPVLGKVFITTYGPWLQATVPAFSTAEAFEILQDPKPSTEPRRNVTYARGFKVNGSRLELVYGSQGVNYAADAVKLSLTAPSDRRVDAPKTFKSRITNRVKGVAPSEIAECFDTPKTTWGDTADAVKSKIEQYMNSAPKGGPLVPFTVNEIDRTDPTNIVKEKHNGKQVKYHGSVFTDQALLLKLDESARALRGGILAGRPKIKGEKWSDAPDYWVAKLEFEWETAPAVEITEDVDVYLVEDEGYVTVYGPAHVEQVTEAYKQARDQKNAELEEAMFSASKGRSLTPTVRDQLLTRPAASKDPVVVDEGNEWWGKFSSAVARVDRVQVPKDVTDSNLKEKYPNGAGGMNSDELDKYVKDKRANGNTDPTPKIIDDIAYPKPAEERKGDKPWWDRVLDTLDGFGSGVKDVLKDWGPMGTVAAYGGVKAVNQANKSPWVWLAIGGLALVLLMKD